MTDDYDGEPEQFVRFPLPCSDGMCWGVDCRSGSRLCDRRREVQEARTIWKARHIPAKEPGPFEESPINQTEKKDTNAQH